MNYKTILDDIPDELVETYLNVVCQDTRTKKDAIFGIVYRELKVNIESQADLDNLIKNMYRKHGCTLSEWIIEYLEDAIMAAF